MALRNEKRPLDKMRQALQAETGNPVIKAAQKSLENSMSMPDIQVNVSNLGVEKSISPVSDKPLRKGITDAQTMAEAERNAKAKQARNKLVT